MKHASPHAALETVERELHALLAEVGQPGAGLEPRLEALLSLIPVLGAAAQHPAYARERDATVAALHRLRARQGELSERLREELAILRDALTRATAGAEAARGYRPGAPAPQLDRVG